MKLVGNGRLGRDVEIRYTPDGKPVGELAMAFNYGRKGEDGKRPTTWVKATLWGEQVERMSSYLVKGSVFDVVLRDVHIQTYERNDGGFGASLCGTVAVIDFTPSQQEAGAAKPTGQSNAKPQQQRQPQRAPQPQQSSEMPFDDDIPF